MRPYSWGLVQCLLLSGAIASPMLGSVSHNILPRHGDGHVPVNATELPQDSGISYFQYDSDPAIQLDLVGDTSRHGGLMLFHGLVMMANYMMLLPTIIVLRNARHRLYWIFQATFWALNLLGWSSGRAYGRTTPDLYPGSTHGTTGALLFGLSGLITTADAAPFLFRKLKTLKYLPLLDPITRAFALVTKNPMRLVPHEDSQYLPVTQSTNKFDSNSSLNQTSVDQRHDSHDEIDMLGSSTTRYDQYHAPPLMSTLSQNEDESLAFKQRRHFMRHSFGSAHSTLHDDPPTPSTPGPCITLYRHSIRATKTCLMILERSLVPYAWGQAVSGFSVYFGLGRTHYITGVMAHFIKGSIFWWYGILTFSRYLGAWRRWGWAWNIPSQHTGSSPWSASFVESLVIFLYGFTQQFMERLGAHEGDPYSSKDIEHISIAVMFWAGGLVGMAIESPTVRGWLLGGSVTHKPRNRKACPPRSANLEISDQNVPSLASNPLPAVIVGITGVAMSAHHQTYQFQVQIHALWGYLLLGFAICRCLTCFFEWVHPGRQMSKLPGMPPTELIGSIFLGAGGFTFICSDEEITLWAMRTDRDDVMMFLNLSIAFTCVAYAWVTVVLLMAGRMRWNRPRL